jgi:hypothetical protein
MEKKAQTSPSVSSGLLTVDLGVTQLWAIAKNQFLEKRNVDRYYS